MQTKQQTRTNWTHFNNRAYNTAKQPTVVKAFSFLQQWTKWWTGAISKNITEQTRINLYTLIRPKFEDRCLMHKACHLWSIKIREWTFKKIRISKNLKWARICKEKLIKIKQTWHPKCTLEGTTLIWETKSVTNSKTYRADKIP